MRTLELRLEDWQVVDWTEAGPAWSPKFHRDKGAMPIDQLFRSRAALEFFDRALLAAFSDMAGLAHSISVPGYASGLAFAEAANLTLLRFGVQIARHGGEE